eukprot:gene7565-9300_t
MKENQDTSSTTTKSPTTLKERNVNKTWSIFNQVDPSTVEPSFYLKNMPSGLLKHYQSGSTIPVYNPITRGTYNVFVVQKLDPNNVERDSVIFLHGQTTTSYMYRNILEPVFNSSLRPILLDLPCFGFSDSLKNCSYDSIADRFSDILDSLQVKSAHLVTTDISSTISLLYYNKHPSRVKSIVFVDPTIELDIDRLPFYYKLARIPIINKLALNFVTSPLMSYPRYLYLSQFKHSNLTRDETDSYFYSIRYRNNINNFINTISNSDLTFKKSYKLYTSKISYSHDFPIFLIISNYQLATNYQNQFVQQKYEMFKNVNVAFAKFLVTEDNLHAIYSSLETYIDMYYPDARKLKEVKPKEQQQQQPSSGTKSHGHYHASGLNHDHSHGHGHHDHGHSHGHGHHDHYHHGHSHGHGHHDHDHSHGHSHGHGHHDHDHSHGHSHNHEDIDNEGLHHRHERHSTTKH